MLFLNKERAQMDSLEIYRRELWTSWLSVQEPAILLLDPRRGAEELRRRCNGPDAFDGGRTAGWLRELREPTWISVKDTRTSSIIHVVSSRSFRELINELRLGLRLMAWMSAPRSLTWYWWDQPWPRVLPAGTDPGREHVNGGWAIPGIREIHVYRREEAHKVLIHEAIHALKLDVPMKAVIPIRMQFEHEFGRRLWPHLGEAYTELFAEWLWTIAGARSIREARTRWSQQLECSETQAATVWARIHDSHEDEDTNVFAYYVLKWVLMSHGSTAMLAPDHRVSQWYVWWRAAIPTLRRLAGAYSENREVRMGMTCGLT